MSVVEKIKQMIVILPHLVASSRRDKIRNGDYFQGMTRGFEQGKERVLKILEDYHLIHKDWKDAKEILDVLGFEDKVVVPKQKLQEVADLLKNRPQTDNYDDCYVYADDLKKWFADFEKLVEVLKS